MTRTFSLECSIGKEEEKKGPDVSDVISLLDAIFVF